MFTKLFKILQSIPTFKEKKSSYDVDDYIMMTSGVDSAEKNLGECFRGVLIYHVVLNITEGHRRGNSTEGHRREACQFGASGGVR